jgi:hypothetical protein
MIYTDSTYAFGVVYTFGKMWAEKGLINSKWQNVVHKELIIRLLENLMLPEETAIVHVWQHQQGNSPEVQGNNLAGEAAKEVALNTEIPILHLTSVVQTSSLTPVFTPQENAQLEKMGTPPELRREMCPPRWEEGTF